MLRIAICIFYALFVFPAFAADADQVKIDFALEPFETQNLTLVRIDAPAIRTLKTPVTKTKWTGEAASSHIRDYMSWSLGEDATIEKFITKLRKDRRVSVSYNVESAGGRTLPLDIWLSKRLRDYKQ